MRAGLTENASPLRSRGLGNQENKRLRAAAGKEVSIQQAEGGDDTGGEGRTRTEGRGSQGSASDKEGAPVSES